MQEHNRDDTQVSYVANGETLSGRLTSDHVAANYGQTLLISNNDEPLMQDDVDHIVVPSEPTKSEERMFSGAVSFGYELRHESGERWTPPGGPTAGEYIP